MLVKDIKKLTDRDTKVLIRNYSSGAWIKDRDVTKEIDNMEVKKIYTKCHECGTPRKMRAQIVLMI